MKICVYSDVHGNKYALEKLQNSLDYKTADLRVFLGDAVMMCPYPNECLQKIWDNGDVFLLGNHDSYCAFGLPEEEYAFFRADKKEHQSYMQAKTLPEYKEKLAKMPKEYVLERFGKKLYFTHYAWESERLVVDDPDGLDAPTIKTAEIFKDIDANYIIFGHNHRPSQFECDGKKFVCVGTLGMSCPGNYVVISIDEKGVRIDKKQVDFDVERLKNDIMAENYPRAPWYCKFFDEE